MVAHLSRKGHEVRAMDLKRAPGLECREFHFGDVTDLMAVRRAVDGMDAVVHLGGRAGNSPWDPQNVLQINVMGTYHVLKAAQESGVKKMVFASSECALGYAMGHWPKEKPFPIEYFPIDEQHPDWPTSEYGLSKVMGEELCKAYTDAHGIQTISLRICTIVLPGEYSTWVGRQNRPENWGNMWAYLDVRDAAEGFRLAVENENLSHEVFYMTASTSGVSTPAEELVARFFPHVKKVSPDLKGDCPIISSDKARRLLGFAPQHTWQSEGACAGG